MTGATPEAIAAAHLKDVAVQGRYGVRYLKYWMNEARGKVFCLCEAPDAEAANRVHREAHGLVAERIIEVDPDLADGMLGGGAVAATGAALAPGGTLDPGVRTPLVTDIVGSTELTQRLGDRAALAIVDPHDRLVREAIERNGDFFGSTVQLAARLCMQAAPGQTPVSSSVADLCGQRRLADVGELALKGFPHAVVEEAWSGAFVRAVGGRGELDPDDDRRARDDVELRVGEPAPPIVRDAELPTEAGHATQRPLDRVTKRGRSRRNHDGPSPCGATAKPHADRSSVEVVPPPLLARRLRDQHDERVPVGLIADGDGVDAAAAASGDRDEHQSPVEERVQRRPQQPRDGGIEPLHHPVDVHDAAA
jgi:hypothetical protein